MIPEAGLMAILVIVFLADLFLKGEKKHTTLSMLTCVLLVAQVVLCFNAQPAEAFAGLYTATAAAQVMKVILTAGAFIVVVMAQSWIEREDVLRKEGEFYELVISTLLGMYMMISSGHFLMFFLGLEMASVPMACLVAFDKYKKNSAEGAAKFVLTATFSSGVMLYGISFLYGACGTLYFDDVAAKISASPLTIMGLVFFFSGLGFKISLVPFHFWTADTYEGAPTSVTAYLSVISKGSAAFVLMTVLMKAFAQSDLFYSWNTGMYWIIVASITVANLFAIRQNNLKRFMAFSAISQAGYLVLAIMDGTAQGMSALVFYLLVYMASNLGAFAVMTTVENNSGKINISDYDGLYQTNPKLAFLMTLCLFSLAGIPPFAGFFSKFFVFMAAFKAGYPLLVFIALANTVISLYYYLLIVKAMYIKGNDTPIATFRSDNYTRVALALCTIGVVALGLGGVFYNYISGFSYGL